MDKIPKVYIAGPDVFLPNATYPSEVANFFEAVSKQCELLQLKALIPFDMRLTEPQEIFQHNLKLIQEADGVIANVNAFRGSEPDSGTCFEIGYARALDKPVVAYLADQSEMFDKVRRHFHTKYKPWKPEGHQLEVASDSDPHPDTIFEDGYTAECWGFPVNLMLQCGTRKITSSLREALIQMRGILHDHW